MQKEKLKKQKGITLIALIITIIVMLILVGVSVTVALQGGLFNTAKDAATKTADAARQETEMLRYEYEIASATGKTDAETFTEYVLDTKYSGLEIGDYVEYEESSNGEKTYNLLPGKGFGISATPNSETGKHDLTEGTISTEDLEWRVLGVNEIGELELISDKITTGKIVVKNIEGYKNYVQVLNEMCNNLYGKGQYAKSGRSLNAEDVNELTGYDPKTYSEYNKEISYSKGNDGYIYENGIKTARTDFSYYDDKLGDFVNLTTENSPKTLKFNFYCYNVKGKSNEELLRGSDDIAITLIANTYIGNDFYNNSAELRLGVLENDLAASGSFSLNSGRRTHPYNGFSSNETVGFNVNSSIRPVVTLKYDVTLTDDNSDGVWEIE